MPPQPSVTESTSSSPLGGEHDDRQVGTALGGPQPAQDLQAVDPGEHEVRNQQVRAVGGGQGEPLRAVGGPVDAVTRPSEVAGHDLGHGRVVTDHQDAAGRR